MSVNHASPSWPQPSRPQQGATLVVVLILLGALMGLALSATQSSALELLMSGNETWRLRAFLAAEAGLAAAQAALAAAGSGTTPAAVSHIAIADAAGDDYSYSARDAGPDTRLAELSGGARSGRHYTLTATGTSRRGAVSSVECGIEVVRDAAGNLLGLQREFWLRRDID